jgi:hypothetical protein
MYNLLQGRKFLFQYELGKFDACYVTVDRIHDPVIKCGTDDGFYDNVVCEGEEEVRFWLVISNFVYSWGRVRLPDIQSTIQ